MDSIKPSYYGGEDNKCEVLKIIEAFNMPFHLGNVLKYIIRAGKKNEEEEIKDLQKASYYLERYIKYLKNQQNE